MSLYSSSDNKSINDKSDRLMSFCSCSTLKIAGTKMYYVARVLLQ